MSPLVVIIAGGVGKRFKPFLQSKPLFPMMGKSLIERTIAKAEAAGFNSFCIVTNPKDEAAIKHIFAAKTSVSIITQQQADGMGGAVLTASKMIGSRPFIVMNAVDQIDAGFFHTLFQQTQSNTSFIVGKKVTQYFNGGYIVSQDGRAQAVIEKPGEGNEPSDLINLVFHYFHEPQKYLQILENTLTSQDDRYEQAVSKYMQTTPVKVLVYEGDWQSLKTGWDVLAMTEYVLRTELVPGNNTRQVAPSAKIEANVYLGHGVVVHENAVIKGPSYIGDNTIIGNNAFIRQSHIGSNSVIGTNCEVARSYLGNNCWLHQNYIGDSILEEDVAMGAGSLTANFRLDEKPISVTLHEKRTNTGRTHLGALIGGHVRIGVQVGLMPGVCIGSQVIIGPHTTLSENVDHHTKVYNQIELKKAPFTGTISKRT